MRILILAISVLLFSCTQNSEINTLQSQINDLHEQMDKSYKPGFGEIMLDIQMHHSKLWFAGSRGNWQLAEFQLHEIEEAIEDIEDFHKNQPETRTIGMLENAVEDVHSSIVNRNRIEFNNSFNNLTQTCNSCHQANDVGFNVIKVPDVNPFDNQRFEPLTSVE